MNRLIVVVCVCGYVPCMRWQLNVTERTFYCWLVMNAVNSLLRVRDFYCVHSMFVTFSLDSGIVCIE